MSYSDIIAICGLLTGTASLLWNVIQWRVSRPRLIFGLTPLALDIEIDHSTELKDIFSITNIGEQPTTVYKCLCEYKLKSGEELDGKIVPGLPTILGPGETHTFDVYLKSKTPGDTVTIIAKIYHSHARMPSKKKVTIQMLDPQCPGAEKYCGEI